jgi:hypothetical protein
MEVGLDCAGDFLTDPVSNVKRGTSGNWKNRFPDFVGRQILSYQWEFSSILSADLSRLNVENLVAKLPPLRQLLAPENSSFRFGYLDRFIPPGQSKNIH